MVEMMVWCIYDKCMYYELLCWISMHLWLNCGYRIDVLYIYLLAIVCGEICLCLWIVMFCIIVCNRIMNVFLTLLLWFNAVMALQTRLLEFFLWSVRLHSFVGQLWYVTLGSRGDRFVLMYIYFCVCTWHDFVLYRHPCLYMRHSVMWFSALIP